MSVESIISNLKSQAYMIGRDKAVDIGYRAYELSQDYCPLDTGKLKESGFIRENKNNIKVGYSAPYALAVHETSNVIKTVKNPLARSQWLREAFIEAVNEAIK